MSQEDKEHERTAKPNHRHLASLPTTPPIFSSFKQRATSSNSLGLKSSLGYETEDSVFARLQHAHLKESSRDLRASFLKAATTAPRYLAKQRSSGSINLAEHSYAPVQQVHLRKSGAVPNAAQNANRTQRIFELMGSYLSSEPSEIEQNIVNHLEYTLARSRFNFDDSAAYHATAFSVRDRLIELWNDTQEYYIDHANKMVCYMSIEYLTGRSLQNAINNLGLNDPYHQALLTLGYDLENVYDMETDAALGNGGLGRLAACFLDSMASLDLPAWGYGLRYRYGMFKQSIVNGYQVETPDYWLGAGNPWEIPRLDKFYSVRFYGQAKAMALPNGNIIYQWDGGETIFAQAYDNPIPGYRTRNVINLRLWESKPAFELNFSSFNAGDYYNAIETKQKAEHITSVLYPNDSTLAGRELRLKQQYFFASATLQDIMDRHKRKYATFANFAQSVSIQLNDTHPSVSILELMRLLIDIEGMSWDNAWAITTQTFSYTNHTVLPEAMEKWEVDLFGNLLPRHLQILYEINFRFMQMLEAQYPGNDQKKRNLSIIEESTPKKIRMAYLAIIASHTVNGVAAIHSQILKESLFKEFAELWPEKFTNVTNGVTPRRWLDQSNPALSDLITSTLKTDKWLQDLRLLSELRNQINDESFLGAWHEAKISNKIRLAEYIESTTGIRVNHEALFDIQIKRIHEYKRQLLNVLGIIHRYQVLKEMTPAERRHQVPRVSIFGGKAAPGYLAAKTIIKLINQVAEVVNKDAETSEYLKVVFLANYNVSLAELVVPASDINQHISTAGTEASGTSNMKFALNGGLILGTMDGANIEIKGAIGDENIFTFGASAEEVERIRHEGGCTIDIRLQQVLRAIHKGDFGLYHEFDNLIAPLWDGKDFYLVAYDFPAYLAAQSEIDKLWRDQTLWTKKSVLTTAGMAFFSSDRSIHQYAKNIWHIKPCPLPLPTSIKTNFLTSKSKENNAKS